MFFVQIHFYVLIPHVGDYHIIRTDILMDVGDSLNPSIDIGQIEGAFVQGVVSSYKEYTKCDKIIFEML